MFQDEARSTLWERFRQQDWRMFERLLPSELIVEAVQGCGITMRRNPLNPLTLVWLAVLGAWHRAVSFAELLPLVLKLLEDGDDLCRLASEAGPPTCRRPKSRKGRAKRTSTAAKHRPQGNGKTVTEEAFVKARRLLPPEFWWGLLLLLAQRFEGQHRERVRWKQFRLLALDGTTIDLPNRSALARRYGRAKNGRSAGPVQARMVLMQFPLVRLPSCCALSALKDGERTLADALLSSLKPNDLLLMDQGFWSYGAFCEMTRRQAYFAIRLYTSARPCWGRWLGPRDRLATLRRPTGPRWRGQNVPDSLTVRVIHYQVRGFRPTAVVTNLLDPHVASREDFVRMLARHDEADRVVPGLYHRRWEIETTFRELKVTQQMEGGLRSHTPRSIEFEIAGHLLLYALTRWLIVEAAAATGQDPLRLSFIEAARELMLLRTALLWATPRQITEIFWPKLLERIASHVVPFRPGRHYPRPHDTHVKKCGHGKTKQPHKLLKAA